MYKNCAKVLVLHKIAGGINEAQQRELATFTKHIAQKSNAVTTPDTQKYGKITC